MDRQQRVASGDRGRRRRRSGPAGGGSGTGVGRSPSRRGWAERARAADGAGGRRVAAAAQQPCSGRDGVARARERKRKRWGRARPPDDGPEGAVRGIRAACLARPGFPPDGIRETARQPAPVPPRDRVGDSRCAFRTPPARSPGGAGRRSASTIEQRWGGTQPFSTCVGWTRGNEGRAGFAPLPARGRSGFSAGADFQTPAALARGGGPNVLWAQVPRLQPEEAGGGRS